MIGFLMHMVYLSGVKLFPPRTKVYSASKAGVVHFTRCIAQVRYLEAFHFDYAFVSNVTFCVKCNMGLAYSRTGRM